MAKLQELFGERFRHFESLGSEEKASFVLGYELWEKDYSSLLEHVMF